MLLVYNECMYKHKKEFDDIGDKAIGESTFFYFYNPFFLRYYKRNKNYREAVKSVHEE